MIAVAGLTTLETAVVIAAAYVGLVLVIFGPAMTRASGPKLPPARADRPAWIAQADQERQARWERAVAASRRARGADNVVPLHRDDQA
jgi:glycerol uptake facilitator-like aquaporin